MKEFLAPNAAERVSHLTKIYKILKDKGVPNVDTLDNSEGNHVFLSPTGWDVWPNSGSEAFEAMVCMLNALKVCYDISVLFIV